ncbi:aspartate aminotransferase family protein [Flavimaricola marinus]|uniref:Adenosylmethionine-8-amino-7-oxononanoate aminotransferase n=1 Tax=Flavimaricola marinus TaxID=1819565 RepID=A0A238LKA1_9RHOB|nr:aspartate aminotransferase family protein [Flavimaricola marinus]SMY10119.1 Adenosylmethionine-8-amino-7-oxononanoate aminotransferase [Flavimaricola marinus]
MSHIFPRHTKQVFPTAVRGEGCYLYDSQGKQYLDASGGAAVSCLGHGDVEIIEAVKAQLDSLAYAHTGFFTSEPAERLASLLIDHAPGDIDRVYLVSGGSEAMEAALKLARQYFVEKGEPKRGRVIARKQSYHGNTMGALSAGGNAWRREQFGPLLIDMSHIDPCYEYRLKHDGESLEDYGIRAANLLEEELLRVGPETVMAFAAEPVVGATAGALTAAPGYFKRIREICDKYGILLILDEVMCGMGRTGSLFACEQEGVSPDIVCVAKGLGAGYQPIGAMLCSKQIYGAIEAGSGFFQHGHTYLGHPTAAAAGVAVVNAILERNLIPRVQEQGEKLMTALADEFNQHPHIGDIRGRGLFQGIELVSDRDTKAPFDPSRKIAARTKSAAFDAGLICYPMSGTIDGRLGDHILLAPPFIIEDSQIDELVQKLSVAIDTALAT